MPKAWKGLPIVIFGTSGFASEVQTLISDINQTLYQPVFNLLGFVTNQREEVGKIFNGLPIVASDNNFSQYASQHKLLAVSLGIGLPKVKELIWQKVLQPVNNLVFPNLVHPAANIKNIGTCQLGSGIIICAGVTATTNISLGNFVTLNINTTIGHNTLIENFTTLNPLVACSGDVKIGKGVLIGAGTAIREGLTIHSYATLGMGSVVVKNIPASVIVAGNPAKPLN